MIRFTHRAYELLLGHVPLNLHILSGLVILVPMGARCQERQGKHHDCLAHESSSFSGPAALTAARHAEP
jgi:hypothetical protein